VWLIVLLIVASAASAPKTTEQRSAADQDSTQTSSATLSLDEILTSSSYSGEPYTEVNGNVPYFDESDLTTEAFETYSELDELGRCGVAYANICTELMPTEERGTIGQIKPSGWHTVRYDDLIDGKYLYNRCHLIGYQLAGENANEKNLITGTRYLNVEGMLPFENQVSDYVKQTDNHVLYRVTPVFEGENLLATGVLMEALSVEDDGAGVSFCVFVYNVQPGIEIDYATGDSHLAEDAETIVPTEPESEPETTTDSTEPETESEPETETTTDSAEPEPETEPESEAEPESEPDTDAETETETKTDTEPEPETEPTTASAVTDTAALSYVLNTNTMKFHKPSCSSVKKIAAYNRSDYTGSRDELIAKGYSPCGNCHP
jgi:DNA-entry nuclease